MQLNIMGVMTLPYGATSYGLSQQVIDDSKKHNISELLTMEHSWASYMGKAIYEECRESLKKPARLLAIFEAAGRKAEADGRYLSWTVPITKFPAVQYYTEGTIRKIYVQYGPKSGSKNSSGYDANTFQLNICFMEEQRPAKNKQGQGASPNIIHSLDAAHLMLTVCKADFPVTTIHDSFGCLLADMPRLFTILRETFVELYQANPLEQIMADIDGDHSSLEIGTLDITMILESEYCFA